MISRRRDRDVANRSRGDVRQISFHITVNIVANDQATDGHRIGIGKVQSGPGDIERFKLFPETEIRIVGRREIDRSRRAHVLVDRFAFKVFIINSIFWQFINRCDANLVAKRKNLRARSARVFVLHDQ